MIQILFGWKNVHLHHFELDEVWYANLDLMDGFDYEDETVSLAEVLSHRRSFLYRYDFGDQWEVRDIPCLASGAIRRGQTAWTFSKSRIANIPTRLSRSEF